MSTNKNDYSSSRIPEGSELKHVEVSQSNTNGTIIDVHKIPKNESGWDAISNSDSEVLSARIVALEEKLGELGYTPGSDGYQFVPKSSVIPAYSQASSVLKYSFAGSTVEASVAGNTHGADGTPIKDMLVNVSRALREIELGVGYNRNDNQGPFLDMFKGTSGYASDAEPNFFNKKAPLTEAIALLDSGVQAKITSLETSLGATTPLGASEVFVAETATGTGSGIDTLNLKSIDTVFNATTGEAFYADKVNYIIEDLGVDGLSTYSLSFNKGNHITITSLADVTINELSCTENSFIAIRGAGATTKCAINVLVIASEGSLLCEKELNRSSCTIELNAEGTLYVSRTITAYSLDINSSNIYSSEGGMVIGEDITLRERCKVITLGSSSSVFIGRNLSMDDASYIFCDDDIHITEKLVMNGGSRLDCYNLITDHVSPTRLNKSGIICYSFTALTSVLEMDGQSEIMCRDDLSVLQCELEENSRIVSFSFNVTERALITGNSSINASSFRMTGTDSTKYALFVLDNSSLIATSMSMGDSTRLSDPNSSTINNGSIHIGSGSTVVGSLTLTIHTSPDIYSATDTDIYVGTNSVLTSLNISTNSIINKITSDNSSIVRLANTSTAGVYIKVLLVDNNSDAFLDGRITIQNQPTPSNSPRTDLIVRRSSRVSIDTLFDGKVSIYNGIVNSASSLVYSTAGVIGVNATSDGTSHIIPTSLNEEDNI